jgi:hypothetical protein
VNVRIAEDVVFRDLAGEAVILNLATGTYFGLDGVGTRIWHLIAEHGSMERIVETVVAEYDVDEGRLRADLAALLAELRDGGLVRLDPTDGR